MIGKPSIDRARRQYEEAQRREFHKMLPVKLDVNVYDYDKAATIRTKIVLHSNGTWEQAE